MDTLTKEKRSALMRKIKGKDTSPEMTVRRLLHSLGYRYRLHRKSLPGSPDLVFGPRRKAIFVHGCYWHGHNCKYGRLPKTNTEFWSEKIEANQLRDERNVRDLELLGWNVLTVWQCELRDADTAQNALVSFLGFPKKTIDKLDSDE